MKKIPPFFTLGTVGIIITAVLHIVMTLLIPRPSLALTFFFIYPVFIIFLAIGFRKILKEQKTGLQEQDFNPGIEQPVTITGNHSILPPGKEI